MKTKDLKALFAAGTLLLAMPAAALAASLTPEELDSMLSRVGEIAEANPSGTPVLVSDRVAQHPDFACEIIKAAIRGSKADGELTTEILITAIRIVPDQAQLLVECALVANPAAREWIVSSIRPAFITAAAATGKRPVYVGKAPVGKHAKVPVVTPQEVAPQVVGITPLSILAARYAGFAPAIINSFILNPLAPPIAGPVSVFTTPPVLFPPGIEPETPDRPRPPRPRPPGPRPQPPATPTDPVQ